MQTCWREIWSWLDDAILERAREFSGVCARSSGAGPYLLSMFDDCKMEFVGEWMHELHVRSIWRWGQIGRTRCNYVQVWKAEQSLRVVQRRVLMNHEANKGQLKARKQGKSSMHKLPADHLEATSQRLNGEIIQRIRCSMRTI